MSGIFVWVPLNWLGKTFFPSTTRCEKFSRARRYLYKAMIWFRKLVETSSSSTKVAKDMRNKYQKKKNRSLIKLRLGNFEHINRGWVKFCSHIPTGDYTEGLKALKTTGNGNCLYNSVSVMIQGDESANHILRLSVTNALHNKRVIYRQCYILS